jgi:hypothetical protein
VISRNSGAIVAIEQEESHVRAVLGRPQGRYLGTLSRIGTGQNPYGPVRRRTNRVALCPISSGSGCLPKRKKGGHLSIAALCVGQGYFRHGSFGPPQLNFVTSRSRPSAARLGLVYFFTGDLLSKGTYYLSGRRKVGRNAESWPSPLPEQSRPGLDFAVHPLDFASTVFRDVP